MKEQLLTERILHLTLKKKWFDLIKSGKKKVEYREIKPYWIIRLTSYNPYSVPCNMVFRDGVDMCRFERKFDYIIFKNGYRKNAPTLKVEWKGLNIGKFEGEKHFAIKLGEIIK